MAQRRTRDRLSPSSLRTTATRVRRQRQDDRDRRRQTARRTANADAAATTRRGATTGTQVDGARTTRRRRELSRRRGRASVRRRTTSREPGRYASAALTPPIWSATRRSARGRGTRDADRDRHDTPGTRRPMPPPASRSAPSCCGLSLEQGVGAQPQMRLAASVAHRPFSPRLRCASARRPNGPPFPALDANGVYRTSLSGEERSRRRGVDAALNLELSNDIRGMATLGYGRRRIRSRQRWFIGGGSSHPLMQTSSEAGSALEKDVGKVRFAVTGRQQRRTMAMPTSRTARLSQEDRNSTLATLTLRGGYEISPALTPFAEVEIGPQRYDRGSTGRLSALLRPARRSRAGWRSTSTRSSPAKSRPAGSAEDFDDDRLATCRGAVARTPTSTGRRTRHHVALAARPRSKAPPRPAKAARCCTGR